jgi:signal transduction histidine kinase
MPGHFSEPLSPVLDRLGPLLDIAELLYERRHLVDLLRESQRPIDFSLNEGQFYDEVMLLAALSAQMEYAVLRELTEDDELRCIGAFGFDTSQRELFDLSPLEAYPPFAEVIRTRRPHTAPNMNSDTYDTLRERDEISKVCSFVAVPVLVGTEIFGTFSFGSSLEYHYSDAETTALTSLANGLGVTIYNYRNFQRAALEVASYADIGTAITAVEVAQAARHEARGLIDDAIVDLLTVTRAINANINGKVATSILDKAASVEERLYGLNIVLDKIKTASRVPGQEKRIIGLREVWEQARSQLTGKLGQARVESCTYDGRDVDVYVAVDWYRQVFINLMLNSLDAFGSGSIKKRGRRIRLVVERPTDRTRDISMTYSDNAGGINPASLKSMDGEPVVAPIEQAIFQPNVTSKSDGSGWGLALVRKILSDHGGSISLADYRGGGTTFRMMIPKPPELAKKES